MAAYINEVRNDIGRAAIPKDAKAPNVIEIKTDNNRVYDATLYSPDGSVPLDKLRILGQELKDQLSLLPNIERIDYTDATNYDFHIVFGESEMRSMNLSLSDVAALLRSYHQDAPIGNFAVENKNYDFRLNGKFSDVREFLSVPITLTNGRIVKLGDIASLEREFTDKSIKRTGSYGKNAVESVELQVNKNDGANIFDASAASKSAIEAALATPAYAGVSVAYANDLADVISDDYRELAREAAITLTLVFVCMWLFVGFRDSLFATLTLPLAFFSTLLLLHAFGFSLNFLTNFSFILSFGIAVDTIIVIVQASSAKMRIGHDPRSAIMIALREFSIPITSGVMTTIVAFVPMMVLPGILGKFLAYIPITLFGVLACGLVLAVSVNSALYLAFIKGNKRFVHDDSILEYANQDERTLLEYERLGKEELKTSSVPLRLRIIHNVTAWYKRVLTRFIVSTAIRRASIALLFGFLILSFLPVLFGKSLAERVGFNLFPASDNGLVNYRIFGAVGERAESMDRIAMRLSDILSRYPEIQIFQIVTKDVKTSTDPGMTISVTLKKLAERKELGLLSVTDLDAKLMADFDSIRSDGFEIDSQVVAG